EGDRADQKGRGRQIAADLLEHDPRLDMAEAEAAILLADQDGVETQLGELLPQAVAEPVLAALVAPVAELLRDRAFLGHEAARRISQHRLIVGEIERHSHFLTSPRRRPGSRPGSRFRRSAKLRRPAAPGSAWR